VNNSILDRKSVIFTIFWAGASPNQNKATAIKLGQIQGLITVDWTWLFKKLFTCKKTMDPAESFVSAIFIEIKCDYPLQ
jgi:hypothetical protein